MSLIRPWLIIMPLVIVGEELRNLPILNESFLFSHTKFRRSVSYIYVTRFLITRHHCIYISVPSLVGTTLLRTD